MSDFAMGIWEIFMEQSNRSKFDFKSIIILLFCVTYPIRANRAIPASNYNKIIIAVVDKCVL